MTDNRKIRRLADSGDVFLNESQDVVEERAGGGPWSFEQRNHRHSVEIESRNSCVNDRTRIERDDELEFMSTPDSLDVDGENALADAIANKDDP